VVAHQAESTAEYEAHERDEDQVEAPGVFIQIVQTHAHPYGHAQRADHETDLGDQVESLKKSHHDSMCQWTKIAVRISVYKST